MPVPVTPDQVRAQLERILASPGFAGSDRARQFLRYVVERTLNADGGEGDQNSLKEYVVGREVFDRGEDYDPRIDSIVRVEAGRLRSKVDEYYAGPGRADTVLIQLRRGSYTPAFEERKPAVRSNERVQSSRWKLGLALSIGGLVVIAAGLVVATLVAWPGGTGATVEQPPPVAQPPSSVAQPPSSVAQPPPSVGQPRLPIRQPTPVKQQTRTESIAVLPFSSYSTDEAAQLLAARVTDGVTSELARLGTLSVVSHTSAQQFAGVRRPLREIAQTLGAQIILEGTVRDEAGHIIINVRLVDATTDRKFWVKDVNGKASDIPEMQRQLAQAASAATLQRNR